MGHWYTSGKDLLAWYEAAPNGKQLMDKRRLLQLAKLVENLTGVKVTRAAERDKVGVFLYLRRFFPTYPPLVSDVPETAANAVDSRAPAPGPQAALGDATAGVDTSGNAVDPIFDDVTLTPEPEVARSDATARVDTSGNAVDPIFDDVTRAPVQSEGVDFVFAPLSMDWNYMPFDEPW